MIRRVAHRPVSWAGYLLLAVLSLAAQGRALGGSGAVAKRPNIVFILADDLGWGDVSFNGRTEWTTPNLDGLAQQGRKLTRFYTGAVTCGPSRAVFMTGKYSIHNGVMANNEDLPAEQVTVAEVLKSAGYRTALFGKWHHGKPRTGQESYVHPMDQGFDEFFGFTDATHAWQKFPTELWDGREKRPVEGHSDDLFTDHAVEFIGRNAAGPFFLYLPYIAAHFNIEAPADEVALHKGKFAEQDPEHPVNATYAAMVTRLDRNVGRVLAALDAAGIADDTLVFFTSDHGATFESGNRGASDYHDSNRPFRGQKRTLWEGGIRVPACVRWPGHVPSGSSSSIPMHAIDIWPTFAALAEASTAKPVDSTPDGVSLVDAWTTGSPLAERDLFWEWRTEGTNQTAAMRGNDKLVASGDARPELFDVDRDPGERRDITALRPREAKALRAALAAWLATEQKFP